MKLVESLGLVYLVSCVRTVILEMKDGAYEPMRVEDVMEPKGL